MQRESQMQVNLRKKIQTFLNVFQEQNDLGNVIPDYLFLYDLIKKGIIINQSQLPDLYSKLQIPIDKRKVFYFDDFESDFSANGFDYKENRHFKQEPSSQSKMHFATKPGSLIKFHLEKKYRSKNQFNFSNKQSSVSFYTDDIILFPLIPYRINLDRKITSTQEQ